MTENTPNTDNSSASSRIARLRTSFLAQVLKRVSEMRVLLARLQQHDSDFGARADLHRILHNLKGTGRSLGFGALGDAAEDAETLLNERQPDALARLGLQLEVIAELGAQAVSTGASAVSISAILPDDDKPARNKPGERIYICDDESFVLEQLAAELGCFGYQTQCFTTPESFRAAFLASPPDAVIMDIHFPQGERAGIDVLLALRGETGLDVPAIFLSSRSDFDARLGAARAGGKAYFVKPAPASIVVAALDQLTRSEHNEAFRILIIDDEPEAAAFHALILQQAGMLTHELHDPRKALEALNSFRPDLVLMDMYMPFCSGREVAEVIRQDPQHVGLPIIYLTSETDRKTLLNAMQIGAEGFLSKPVDPAELISAVSVRAERMRTLRSLMARDGLTGLFNHTMSAKLIERAFKHARRDRLPLSLVMLDIDNFKLVNDNYGHPSGDQVLIALARVLQQRLRGTDIIGRYGGEEFIIALQNESPIHAASVIDRLHEDFSRISFHSAGQSFRCSFSAGVAGFPQHGSVEALSAAADVALYAAKRGGRNRVVIDAQSNPQTP